MKILSNTRAAAGGLALAALTAAGVGLAAAPANAATSSTWDSIAQCESGGNWSIDTGNGFYGGLQFTLSTWHAFGGAGNPANASRSTQISVAERVLASQGWGAWPACSAKLGLSGHSGAVSGASTSTAAAPVAAPTHTVSAPVHAAAPVHTAAAPTAATGSVGDGDNDTDDTVGSAPRHASTVALSGKTYTVRSGDTLAKIASQLGLAGGWQHLADANTATVANPDLIFPGQTLHIPA